MNGHHVTFELRTQKIKTTQNEMNGIQINTQTANVHWTRTATGKIKTQTGREMGDSSIWLRNVANSQCIFYVFEWNTDNFK